MTEEEFALEAAEAKLAKLTSKYTYTSSYDVRGGDVYGGQEKTATRGKQREIDEAIKEVERLRKIVAEQKKFKAEKDNQTRAAEYAKTYDEGRAKALKKARQRYKQQSILRRAIDKIGGRAPKWEKIEQQYYIYDTEKLDSMYTGKKK